MNPAASELRSQLQAWVEGLPKGTVALAEVPVAEDDEYGTELSFELRPKHPAACPIDIGITARDAATYFFLDTWSALARRAGVETKRAQEKSAVLFHEPAQMPNDLPLAICRAIARGSIDLLIGLRGTHIIATYGGVRLEGGEVFRMRGLEEWPRSAIVVLSWLRLGELRRFRYAPWVD